MYLSSVVPDPTVVPPDPGTDTQKFALDAFQAIQNHNWKYVAALGIIFTVFAIRKWGSKFLPFLSHGKWAWATTVAVGALGSLGNALLANVPLGGASGVFNLLAQGGFIGLGAAGLFKGMNEWKGPKASPPPAEPPAP